FYFSPTTLELSGRSFSEPKMAEIASSKWWPSLKALHINDSPLKPVISNDIITKLLGTCPNLCEFSIKDCVAITDKTFSQLASSCRKITHVSIENCPNLNYLSLAIITMQFSELASLAYIGSPQIFQKYQISGLPRQDDTRMVHLLFQGDHLKRLHTACWQWSMAPEYDML